jgi:hypothetical protein
VREIGTTHREAVGNSGTTYREAERERLREREAERERNHA